MIQIFWRFTWSNGSILSNRRDGNWTGISWSRHFSILQIFSIDSFPVSSIVPVTTELNHLRCLRSAYDPPTKWFFTIFRSSLYSLLHQLQNITSLRLSMVEKAKSCDRVISGSQIRVGAYVWKFGGGSVWIFPRC